MATRLKPANAETVEAWRPALIAFYRADAWFQSAENLERGYQLSAQDIRLIEALQKAFQRAPRATLKIAA
jgi:hypothetical protein